MRMIDADNATKRIQRKHDALGAEWLDKFGCLCAMAEIAVEQTVDAVKVIRCRECAKNGTGDCPMFEAVHYRNDGDGFCDFGLKAASYEEHDDD